MSEGKPMIVGIKCRKCECRDLRVVETRQAIGFIIRRRECRHCGTRMTTREKIVVDQASEG